MNAILVILVLLIHVRWYGLHVALNNWLLGWKFCY